MALTPAQQTTLANAIKASTDPVVQTAYQIGDAVTLANWVNSASTTVVWKSFVPKAQVGKAFVATAIAAITAGNNDKLSSYALWNPEGVDPSRADTRAFFDDIFSVTAGASTRAALLALWKRFATQAERLFVTGTGTDQTPALLGWEGTLSVTEVSVALNNNP